MNRKVAYITSGKIGIHRFTFNELKLLEEKAVSFEICLTQLKPGPCMPEPNWQYHTANRLKAILQFIQLLFSNKKVLNLLIEAKNKKVLAYFFMALSFYHDLKNGNTRSLHCQMGDDKLYIGYFLKKIMDIPLTVTVHAHELYMRKVYDNNKQIQELYDACDKVITISNFNSRLINKSFGINNSDIEVMRLFPSIDDLNLVNNKIKILIVANWVEKKGYEVLFKAIKKLNRDDVVLWAVGGSNLAHDAIDIEELIKKYEIEDKVAIFGRQGSPILDIIFYACDIFCLPSYTDLYPDGKPSEREGIPVSLMEAMAWGKPVIATDHAGNSELVEQVLVKERDVDGLAKAISYLLDNKEKWNEMGQRNKEIINERFSKSNIEVLVNTFNNLN